ncbi:exodeoxyribonuclease VII small subunit [Phosphitispora sp. TUW77]|uniref:exodeoxyribonuclease VII small subunit n=1 Tax=Phosphitispora sp. TUW77 TaxID=3152361 RepID=UPI003AB825D4
MAADKINNEPTFEEALNELETIVRLMEAGSLDLEDALARFEKGIFLSRICSKKLQQAEKRIEMLLCQENGEIILKPAGIMEEKDE